METLLSGRKIPNVSTEALSAFGQQSRQRAVDWGQRATESLGAMPTAGYMGLAPAESGRPEGSPDDAWWNKAPGAGTPSMSEDIKAYGNGAAGVFRAELAASGLPDHVIHGIMMNGKDESNFNPSAVGDNGNARGILQWNGPRKRGLEQFAQANGGSPDDPRIQARFTLYELNGPERNALNAMMSAQTAGAAGAAFVNLYERPAEVHRARREAAYLAQFSQ